MAIQNFIFFILRKIQKDMEGEVEVSLRDVIKNNGVVLTGLTFTKKDINISPTVYLEDFYKDYENGKSIEEVLEEIKTIYYESKLEKDVNMDFFTDYKNAKNRIVYKLVNYDKNRELLKEIPHRKFLDLAIVYYYLVDIKEFSNATILIHNSHTETWNVKEEDLYDTAKINTPALLKVRFCGMLDVLEEISEDDFIMEKLKGKDIAKESGKDNRSLTKIRVKKDETGMYVLSNRSRMFGAVSVLYEGVLESCATQLEANLFILPSSVHEVILIPDDGQILTEKLEDMVREVNATQLEIQEFLSDTIYYYSVETKGIVRL